MQKPCQLLGPTQVATRVNNARIMPSFDPGEGVDMCCTFVVATGAQNRSKLGKLPLN